MYITSSNAPGCAWLETVPRIRVSYQSLVRFFIFWLYFCSFCLLLSVPCANSAHAKEGLSSEWIKYSDDEAVPIRNCLEKSSQALWPQKIALPAAHTIGWIRATDPGLLDNATDIALKETIASWAHLLTNNTIVVSAWVSREVSQQYARSVSARAANILVRKLIESSIPQNKIKAIFYGKDVQLVGAKKTNSEHEFVITISLTPTPSREVYRTWYAHTEEESVALVRDLYNLFSWEISTLGIPLVGIEESSSEILSRYFSKELRTALLNDKKCSERRGMPCAIDWKILWASQDPGVCWATVQKPTLGKIISAKLHLADNSVTTVQFVVVNGKEGPAIEDIVDGKGLSVYRNLIRR